MFLRPGGILTDGDREHFDTFTCAHCNHVVIVKAMCRPEDAGGKCMVCDKNICGGCADKRRCTPFERALELDEARSRFRRDLQEC